MSAWRVGSKVPLNVYEGDRPVCQCHSAEDAARIVAAMNGAPIGSDDPELLAILKDCLGCEFPVTDKGVILRARVAIAKAEPRS